jgi:4-amino-4-deoxy-L-arabinose transferase-like glycosyltransferase
MRTNKRVEKSEAGEDNSTQNSRKNLRRYSFLAIGLICLFGFLLRMTPLIVNWEHPHFFFDFDSRGYDRIARNLLEGNGYSSHETAPFIVNVYRPPGMPLILLSVYKLFGPKIPYAIFLQIIVGTAVIFMTYSLTRKVFEERIATMAAFFLAVEPLSIAYDNLLLTEVYSSAILMGAGLIAIGYIRTGARRFLLILGLLLGLGIMIHPIILFLPFFIMLLPLHSRKTTTRSHLISASVGLLIGITPAAFWIARNVKVADYAGISCVTAVNLLKYKAAGVTAEINGSSQVEEMHNLSFECEKDLPPNATQGTRWRAWESKARSILLAHPFIYLKLHFRGMFREFFGPGRDDVTRFVYGAGRVSGHDGTVTNQSITAARENNIAIHLDLIRYAALFIQFLTYAFFIVGSGSLIARKRFKLAVSLLFPVAYILFLSGGPEAFCRFRVSYMPYICILAALGLYSCLQLSNLLYKKALMRGIST